MQRLHHSSYTKSSLQRRFASTSSVSEKESTSSLLQSSLVDLQPFFATSPQTSTSNPAWAQRVRSALDQAIAASSNAPSEVLIVRQDESSSSASTTDVLAALVEDGVRDPAGDVPMALHELRSRSAGPSSIAAVEYSETLGQDYERRTLSAPLPWLRDSRIRLQEMAAGDLGSQEACSQIYLASQVLVALPYTAIFSPSQPRWVSQVLETLRTFASHPGLRVVLTHSGQAIDEHDASTALNSWISSAGVEADVPVSYVNIAKAREAQGALRGAMGSASSSSGESVNTNATTDRSALWSRFSTLSKQSGLPALVNSISSHATSNSPDYHLSLLLDHAEQTISAQLALAQSDVDSIRSLAAHLEQSATAQGERLSTEVLSSVTEDIVRPLGQDSSSAASPAKEPPLLPKWWKLPFLGDARARERIQEALQRDWLGGRAVEDRLIWWTGRLVEEEAKERKDVRQIVAALLAGQAQSPAVQETGPTGDQAVAEPSPRIKVQSYNTIALPPSQQLAIRSAAFIAGSDSKNDSATASLATRNPRLLALPILQARDEMLGRRTTTSSSQVHVKARQSGSREDDADIDGYNDGQRFSVSLLDSLQRRLQLAVYRFYSMTSASALLATWGGVSGALFPEITESAASSAAETNLAAFNQEVLNLLTSVQFSPSTSLGVFLFGLSASLWTLQRSHSRIARRLLTRDLLKRVPSNVVAELETLVKTRVVGGDAGLYGARSRVGRVLSEWCQGRPHEESGGGAVGAKRGAEGAVGMVQRQREQWKRVLMARRKRAEARQDGARDS